MAVLLLAVVFASKANAPTATLSAPVELTANAFLPTATLLEAVVFDSNALIPQVIEIILLVMNLLLKIQLEVTTLL